MSNDTIALWLPLKPQYLGILRATTGVVAGTSSFTYDEIMQLRTAVSEAFGLAIKQVTPREEVSEVGELAVRFVVEPDVMEILITSPLDYTSHLDSEEGKESQAVLRNLMDEVRVGADAAGKTVLRMVKYKSTETA